LLQNLGFSYLLFISFFGFAVTLMVFDIRGAYSVNS